MGIYLSHLRNQKADPLTGRVPDENFAREVMQLFSIGLTEINLDGTPKLVNGQPVETYTNADITGLARVFTGWSWAAQDTSNASFNGGGTAYADRILRPMQPYPQFHETGEQDLPQRDDPRQHIGAGEPDDRARHDSSTIRTCVRSSASS